MEDIVSSTSQGQENAFDQDGHISEALDDIFGQEESQRSAESVQDLFAEEIGAAQAASEYQTIDDILSGGESQPQEDQYGAGIGEPQEDLYGAGYGSETQNQPQEDLFGAGYGDAEGAEQAPQNEYDINSADQSRENVFDEDGHISQALDDIFGESGQSQTDEELYSPDSNVPGSSYGTNAGESLDTGTVSDDPDGGSNTAEPEANGAYSGSAGKEESSQNQTEEGEPEGEGAEDVDIPDRPTLGERLRRILGFDNGDK